MLKFPAVTEHGTKNSRDYFFDSLSTLLNTSLEQKNVLKENLQSVVSRRDRAVLTF